MCFSLRGVDMRWRPKVQRLERDFAIHKVLPVLITGGWGHQRGEGRSMILPSHF